MTRPRTFKQLDVTRLLRAAKAAGYAEAVVETPDGVVLRAKVEAEGESNPEVLATKKPVRL